MELEMMFYEGSPKGTGTELHSLRNKHFTRKYLKVCYLYTIVEGG